MDQSAALQPLKVENGILKNGFNHQQEDGEF